MKPNQESNSNWPLSSMVVGVLALCCIVELLAAGGLGLGLIGGFGSWFVPVVAGALLLCLTAVLYGYKHSSRKKRH